MGMKTEMSWDCRGGGHPWRTTGLHKGTTTIVDIITSQTPTERKYSISKKSKLNHPNHIKSKTKSMTRYYTQTITHTMQYNNQRNTNNQDKVYTWRFLVTISIKWQYNNPDIKGMYTILKQILAIMIVWIRHRHDLTKIDQRGWNHESQGLM